MRPETESPAGKSSEERPSQPPSARRTFGKRQAAALVVVGIVGLAVIGWLAARQIRSPAQIAADTAPPRPSEITVPVSKRTLSSDVIVRGTVRYGRPMGVVLGTSKIKQGNSDIVTRPPVRRTELRPGNVAMAVDGRPVFLLAGAVPMHRDLAPGDQGPDVLQLERGLASLGFDPGAVDGSYDSGTEGAVSALYLRHGWDPFGPTDAQLDQLHTAQAAAATARDAYLQALNAIAQAHQTPTRAEVAQARIDAVTARDAYNTAVLAAQAAEAKLVGAKSVAASAPSGPIIAAANQRKDEAAADADVAGKQSALNAATDRQQVARTKVGELPVDAARSDREAAAAEVRQATDGVAQAQAELDASKASADAVRAAGPSVLQKAGADAEAAARDLVGARAELRRARVGVQTARSQTRLAAERARLLARPADTSAMQAIARAAGDEARRTRGEVARLSRESGVQVPANEILFFRSFPLRVDTVKAKRGSQITGTVMNVTNSRLAVDSSLAVSDAALVRRGNRVVIEEQELGVKAQGVVSRVSRTPGTNRVDPSRFYLQVVPDTGPVSLVGASVKLTIAVKTTKGNVLTVPVSALSLGGDGNARLQVRRAGRTVTVTVIPGLAAKGLVEVRPALPNALRRGDLVVVGTRGGDRALGAKAGGP